MSEEQTQQSSPPQAPVAQQQTQEMTGWKLKIKRFYQECKRVIRITKKPDKEEFLMLVKVTGLGILIIGLVGFLIHMIKELLF